MSTDISRRELADGKLVVEEPAEGVTRLTISNPAKRNALDHPILDAITQTLGQLERARCVIVTGAHGMFSAGYDIGEIPDDEFELRAERLVAHPFTEAIDALEAFPYPTLAMLPGHTIGGGLELFLLGRYIDAQTALSWGLVNRVASEHELERAGLELASELAGNAPLAQRGNKRVIAALLNAEGELPGDVADELIELRRSSFASADMREGMRAFAEKRPASWRGE